MTRVSMMMRHLGLQEHVVASILQLLHVVQMLVRLHVDAEVTLRGGRIVADFAAVGLLATRIRLASR